MEGLNPIPKKPKITVPAVFSIFVVVFVISYIVLIAFIGPKSMEITNEDIKPVVIAIQELRTSIELTSKEIELEKCIQEKIGDICKEMGSSSSTINHIDKVRAILKRLSVLTDKNRNEYSAKLKQLLEAQKELHLKGDGVSSSEINSVLLKIDEFNKTAHRLMLLDKNLNSDLSFVIEEIDKVTSAKDTLNSSESTIKTIIPGLQEIEKKVRDLSTERANNSGKIWSALNELEDTILLLSEKAFQHRLSIQISNENSSFIWKDVIWRLDSFFNVLWPWPFIVAFIVLLLLLTGAGRDFSTQFLTRLHELKIAEILSLKMGSDTKDEIETNVEIAMLKNKKALEKKYDQYVADRKIIEKFHEICSNTILPWIKDNAVDDSVTGDLRCTIHIPYAMIDRSLYQLVEYWPPRVNGKKGRVLSERFGIIGLAFRTNKPEVNNCISTDPDKLVQQWGMRLNEAQVKSERQSMIAIPLYSNTNDVVAIVYLDSPQKEAFILKHSRDQNFADALYERIAEAFKDTGLLDNLIELISDVGKKTLRIAIYG